ncbi:MAG: type II secretion system protein [bacterium]
MKKLRSKPSKNQRGFTLVELLVVIVILGILSAVVITRFAGASKDAKEANLKANLNGMRSQLEIYKARSMSNDYPLTLATLSSEGYVRKVPNDPFYKKNEESAALTAETGDGTSAGGWVYDSDEGTIFVDLRSDDPTGPPIDTSWGDCYSAW